MTDDVLRQILDLARWAPSGDNTQPWRFEIVAPDHVIVHGFDTRDHCVYDFDGRPSQMANGALIENIAIAASNHGLRAMPSIRPDGTERAPRIDVRLVPHPSIAADPLCGYIQSRSVQRRALSLKALSATDKTSLESAVGTGYDLVWLESPAIRRKVIGLLWTSARLRLTIPEAYRVHRSVIAWGSKFSEDRVPDQAIGLDPLALRLMAWVLQSWERVEFFNTYLAGTVLPRLQLDVLPGWMCGAHFAIVPRAKPSDVEAYVAAGRAMQRFWLTAVQLGLQLQPEMAPLIFANYARSETPFSARPDAMDQARTIARRFSDLLGDQNAARATFFGRVGFGRPAVARSTRLPLERLMYQPSAATLPTATTA